MFNLMHEKSITFFAVNGRRIANAVELAFVFAVKISNTVGFALLFAVKIVHAVIFALL